MTERSKQLLEIAKTGVKRAICLATSKTNEQNEERAICQRQGYANEWINQQLEALGVELT